jgi:hypothetical protein
MIYDAKHGYRDDEYSTDSGRTRQAHWYATMQGSPRMQAIFNRMRYPHSAHRVNTNRSPPALVVRHTASRNGLDECRP